MPAPAPTPALTAPQNLFLQAFGVCRNDSVVLDIPLEKALRAGANVEGYYQTLQVLQQTNEMLSQLDSVERRKVVKDMEKNLKSLTETLSGLTMEGIRKAVADFVANLAAVQISACSPAVFPI